MAPGLPQSHETARWNWVGRARSPLRAARQSNVSMSTAVRASAGRGLPALPAFCRNSAIVGSSKAGCGVDWVESRSWVTAPVGRQGQDYAAPTELGNSFRGRFYKDAAPTALNA